MSTSIQPSRFPNKNELKRFARCFVKERMLSLEKDIVHCLQPPYAPFPAILYCLSSIDLLGSAKCWSGSKDPITKENVNTKSNSRQYMQQYMNYIDYQANIIVDLFRHKLVHLAQPKPCILYNNKVVA